MLSITKFLCFRLVKLLINLISCGASHQRKEHEMQRRSSSDCNLDCSLSPVPTSEPSVGPKDKDAMGSMESSFRPGGLLASRKSLQPGDLAHPVESGFYNPERRLSIQMGSVMVSFDVACCEQTQVPEDELLCKSGS